MSVEGTLVFGLVVLWFALAWQMNRKFQLLQERVDDRVAAIHEQFEGLRGYLYEIDPQFAEERDWEKDFAEDTDPFAGSILNKIQKEKEEKGQRTLDTRFRDFT